MKKEIILTLIILGIIIIVDILTNKNLDNKLDSIIEILDKIETNSRDKDDKKIKESFNKFEKEWMKTENQLSYYIEHDELEKVGTEIENIRSSIEANDYDEILNDVKRTQFILKHIESKTKLKWKNIF